VNNLLVINFEMNDASPVLGWQNRVVNELAVHYDHVVVFTQKNSIAHPPEKITIVELPKIFSRFPIRWLGGRMLYSVWFIPYQVKYRFRVCFIHMSHLWAFRFFPAFKLSGIRVLLWYAHGSVKNKLKLAHRCVDRVITSTPEGFRLPSAKKVIIGQGIDVEMYDPARLANVVKNDLIYVGRITERKRVHVILELFGELVKRSGDKTIKLKLIGPVMNADDERYLQNLQIRAQELQVSSQVDFIGPLPPEQIPSKYMGVALHINLSQTGSMDKTIMEALAMGCPVITSNEAVKETLSGHPELFVDSDASVESLTTSVMTVLARVKQGDYTIAEFRNLIVGKNDLPSYISKIQHNLADLSNYEKNTIDN